MFTAWPMRESRWARLRRGRGTVLTAASSRSARAARRRPIPASAVAGHTITDTSSTATDASSSGITTDATCHGSARSIVKEAPHEIASTGPPSADARVASTASPPTSRHRSSPAFS